MAAKHCYRKGFLLLLFNFISTAALEKRFSDFKRCADEECSMLLCRGKAIRDFTGPDCRFLSFKKSETIYVYYKLSGRRTDMWAGSVGNNFGYFPKDLLAVNHLYTEKEVEIRAEETDFVCFDTGFDKFDSYDIDSLLVPSEEKNEATSDQIKEAKIAVEETPPSEEATSGEQQAEHYDNLDDPSASSHVPHDTLTESPVMNGVESDATATLDGTAEEVSRDQGVEPVLEIMSEERETKDTPTISEEESVPTENEPISVSVGAQIPAVETTLGTTFDAVATDDEITKNVTPHEEDDSEDEEYPPEEVHDSAIDTPLLSFSENTVDTPASASLKPTESPPTRQDKPKTEEGNVWTSIGDVMFSVVTGGERTTHDLSSEEDEDDEDQEEEPATQTPLSFDAAKTNVQTPKPPENIKPTIQDPPQSRTKQQDTKETNSDPDALVFEDEGEVVGYEQVVEELIEPPAEPIRYQKERSVPKVEPLVQDDLSGRTVVKESHTQSSAKPTVNQIKEDKSVEPDVKKNDLKTQDSSVVTQQDLDQTVSQQALDTEKIREDQKKESVVFDVNHKVNIADPSLPDHIHAHTPTDLKSNDDPEGLFFEEEEEPMDEVEEERNGVKEELLEDENALSYSQTDANKPPETVELPDETPEPEYSDSVMRLTLLREHLTEDSLVRVQKYVGLKNLFKIEAMFNDLDTELRATRQSDSATIQDIENALEAVLETSENAILDHIESILDSQSPKQDFDYQVDRNNLDEETQILDDFQELAFSLRQKYSTNSDSTPVAAGETPDAIPDEEVLNTTVDIHHVVEENLDNISETENIDNLTATNHHEQPTEMEKEQLIPDEVPSQPDISMEGDGGHFNKNKDDPLDFSTSDEMQKVPQDTFENPLDVGFGVEVDQPTSGSMDSIEPVPEIAQEEEEAGYFLTGMVYSGCILSMMRNKTEEWTTVMISLLPEEWKPGETLFGCPWSAVVITVLVGVMTFTLFFWRTVLAVKKREYLVDEKKLTEQIQSLKKEKQSALDKISELQKQTEHLKESQKQSNVTISGTRKKMVALETKVLEAETLNEEMIEEKRKYEKLLQEERENTHRNETRIEKLEKSNEKLQLSRKKIQEALAKTSVLLDEAKIREDARSVQQKCQEKEFATLKEENKSFKAAIKTWEEKHKELNEQIKVYQKSQKELEDSVVLKDHNVEVLSDLLADLDACDSQKSDTKAVANGEVELDKKTIIKNRIKQMMDVSRVQTTLTVVEEERDRFMAKLLGEEKTRKTLEEQHQELEHAIATLKSEKSHVENQFKILQQKNEIMVEMYQQKENALQQRLTKEELERRSKESLLSEVGGKAVEAEEQVKVLRQRINEMEEQMKKTEEVYKEQIKEQENKTHSNWVNARNAERALNQEKLESSKLREKLAVLTSQLNERRAPLFRPNSGQPTGPRQGDSYGPSPVSGGAPSPPLMIEGPRRPPSAPVGRRIDPYGPRPPSDPHGRYAENKHISGLDMTGPRSSSPANLDASTQAVDPQIKADSQAEASTESPEPVGPASFLASPIRDSPGPLVQGPPPGHGPHDPMLPPGPHIRLPPPGPYRPPRPGPYHLPPGPPPPNIPPPLHGPPLPANGYPGMPPPGPMGGDFGPRPANGHAFPPRPGPGHVMDHRGPLPPHFRPPPPHHFGPMPPPHDIRGPMGPRPPVPPDSRFPGQREHTGPLMDMPPGVPPHPSLQNSAGAHSGPGQDLRVKQEAPQDSARPAAVKP